jgi:hypothetical protein
MRNQPAVRIGILLSALGASACSGNQASNALLPDASSPSVSVAAAIRKPNGSTTLAITLPPIQPKDVAIDWTSLPNSLSSATDSIAGTIGKKSFGPIALTSSQSNCQPSGAGLVCTVTVPTAPGDNVPVQIATYEKKIRAGDQLATGTVTLSIFKAQKNVAKPAMYGIARGIGMSAQQNTLTQGFVAYDRLAVYGIDAAKRPIPSYNSVVNAAGALQTKFEIELSGPVKVAKYLHACGRNQNRCWGYVEAFIYNGLRSGTETITVTKKGFADATQAVNVLPGSQTVAPLLTRGTFTVPGLSETLAFVSEFPLDANGNIAPTRTFMPGDAPSYGEDANGDFWVGATHLSNRGAVLGTVTLPVEYTPAYVDGKGRLYAFSSSPQCTLDEFPAGVYGTPTPVRQINFGSCSPGNVSVDVDDAGDVFIAGLSGSSPVINEYASTGSGAIAPTRTIPVAQSLSGFDTDAAGNLYVLTLSFNGTFTSDLQEFAPGSTTGTALLAGTFLQNFAVDDAGDIYGCEAANGPQYWLEYFQAGSNTPSRTINGNNTMLSCDPIVVPRS